MYNLTTTCFIMGTCHPTRLEWLQQTVSNIDEQNYGFDRKYISIDQFGGHTLPAELKKKFEDNGWYVDVESVMSRVYCLDKFLKNNLSDLVFYHEDDVLIKLPKKETINFIFDTKINDKFCGMVSMNMGGNRYDPANKSFGDLANIPNNTIVKNDEFVTFRRQEEFSNGYFFEFPGLFIRSVIFNTCLDYCKNNLKGHQIESALTHSYFTTGMQNHYYKCSYTRSNILSNIHENPYDFQRCLFMKFLDKDQGNGVFGGNSKV